ncbi:hypothetical protein XF30_11225 [Bradyrhizobium sp. SUTN9-2]|nr:hypothetical protein XF30_11225 [Bradyrhizobium sp. SUTN9-2]
MLAEIELDAAPDERRYAKLFAIAGDEPMPLRTLDALAVSFQEVVHPVRNEEAEVVEALANPRRTEWTPIRMRL